MKYLYKGLNIKTKEIKNVSYHKNSNIRPVCYVVAIASRSMIRPCVFFFFFASAEG